MGTTSTVSTFNELYYTSPPARRRRHVAHLVGHCYIERCIHIYVYNDIAIATHFQRHNQIKYFLNSTISKSKSISIIFCALVQPFPHLTFNYFHLQ